MYKNDFKKRKSTMNQATINEERIKYGKSNSQDTNKNFSRCCNSLKSTHSISSSSMGSDKVFERFSLRKCFQYSDILTEDLNPKPSITSIGHSISSEDSITCRYSRALKAEKICRKIIGEKFFDEKYCVRVSSSSDDINVQKDFEKFAGNKLNYIDVDCCCGCNNKEKKEKHIKIDMNYESQRDIQKRMNEEFTAWCGLYKTFYNPCFDPCFSNPCSANTCSANTCSANPFCCDPCFINPFFHNSCSMGPLCCEPCSMGPLCCEPCSMGPLCSEPCSMDPLCCEPFVNPCCCTPCCCKKKKPKIKKKDKATSPPAPPPPPQPRPYSPSPPSTPSARVTSYSSSTSCELETMLIDVQHDECNSIKAVTIRTDKEALASSKIPTEDSCCNYCNCAPLSTPWYCVQNKPNNATCHRNFYFGNGCYDQRNCSQNAKNSLYYPEKHRKAQKDSNSLLLTESSESYFEQNSQNANPEQPVSKLLEPEELNDESKKDEHKYGKSLTKTKNFMDNTGEFFQMSFNSINSENFNPIISESVEQPSLNSEVRTLEDENLMSLQSLDQFNSMQPFSPQLSRKDTSLLSKKSIRFPTANDTFEPLEKKNVVGSTGKIGSDKTPEDAGAKFKKRPTHSFFGDFDTFGRQSKNNIRASTRKIDFDDNDVSIDPFTLSTHNEADPKMNMLAKKRMSSVREIKETGSKENMKKEMDKKNENGEKNVKKEHIETHGNEGHVEADKNKTAALEPDKKLEPKKIVDNQEKKQHVSPKNQKESDSLKTVFSFGPRYCSESSIGSIVTIKHNEKPKKHSRTNFKQFLTDFRNYKCKKTCNNPKIIETSIEDEKCKKKRKVILRFHQPCCPVCCNDPCCCSPLPCNSCCCSPCCCIRTKTDPCFFKPKRGEQFGMEVFQKNSIPPDDLYRQGIITNNFCDFNNPENKETSKPDVMSTYQEFRETYKKAERGENEDFAINCVGQCMFCGKYCEGKICRLCRVKKQVSDKIKCSNVLNLQDNNLFTSRLYTKRHKGTSKKNSKTKRKKKFDNTNSQKNPKDVHLPNDVYHLTQNSPNLSSAFRSMAIEKICEKYFDKSTCTDIKKELLSSEEKIMVSCLEAPCPQNCSKDFVGSCKNARNFTSNAKCINSYNSCETENNSQKSIGPREFYKANRNKLFPMRMKERIEEPAVTEPLEKKNLERYSSKTKIPLAFARNEIFKNDVMDGEFEIKKPKKLDEDHLENEYIKNHKKRKNNEKNFENRKEKEKLNCKRGSEERLKRDGKWIPYSLDDPGAPRNKHAEYVTTAEVKMPTLHNKKMNAKRLAMNDCDICGNVDVTDENELTKNEFKYPKTHSYKKSKKNPQKIKIRIKKKSVQNINNEDLFEKIKKNIQRPKTTHVPSVNTRNIQHINKRPKTAYYTKVKTPIETIPCNNSSDCRTNQKSLMMPHHKIHLNNPHPNILHRSPFSISCSSEEKLQESDEERVLSLAEQKWLEKYLKNMENDDEDE